MNAHQRRISSRKSEREAKLLRDRIAKRCQYIEENFGIDAPTIEFYDARRSPANPEQGKFRILRTPQIRPLNN